MVKTGRPKRKTGRPKTAAAAYTRMIGLRVPPSLFVLLAAHREATGKSMNRMLLELIEAGMQQWSRAQVGS